MIRFYARVSSEGQNLSRQFTAFESLKDDFKNVEEYNKDSKIYFDKMSGSNANRPQLKKMLADLQEGDIVIVKDLDRLTRSTIDLDNIITTIKEKKANLKILQFPMLDIYNDFGVFLLDLMTALAKMERKNIRRRQKEGIAVAKAIDEARIKNGESRIKYKGRPKGIITLIDEDKIKQFKNLYKSDISISEIARTLHINPRTVHKWAETLYNRGELKELRHNNKYNRKDK